MASQYFAGLFSALTSEACVIINTPPTFSGVSSVVANSDGSVTVNWAAATAIAVPPVRYQVFIASGSVSGAVLFAGMTYLVTGTNATVSRVYTDASGNTLIAGSVYTFGVRAVDSVGNQDSNLVVATATVLFNLYALVQSVPGAVWEQTLAAHVTPGTFGLQLDTTVSSRLPTSSYVAPDNAGITAIQAKTDNLPVDPASETTSQQILTIVETLSSGDYSQSLIIPSLFSIPETGTEVYRLFWKHSQSGVPTNPAVGPTITIFEQDGTTVIVPATAMTNLSAGLFYYDYTVTPSAFVGEVIVSVTHKNEISSPLDTIIAQARQSGVLDVNVQEIVDGVWNEQTSLHQQAGSFGLNAQTPSLNPTQVASAVWDAQTNDYDQAGSFGLVVQTPSLNPVEVADAVWDALVSDYQEPGSMGQALSATAFCGPLAGFVDGDDSITGQVGDNETLVGTIQEC